MASNHKHFIIFHPLSIVFMTIMIGCAPVISRQIREQANPAITFKDVFESPLKYKGQIIILGGVIISAKNTSEGTLLEILQRPLGFRGEPKDVDRSEGRFLALSSQYLDVAIYSRNRLVTIAGEIYGQKKMSLNGIEYPYPLLHIKEIYIWPELDYLRPYPYYPYPYYYPYRPYYYLHRYHCHPSYWY